MVNYQDAKIYKLVGYGKTYYGSTTQALCQRKQGHKRNKDCKSIEIFNLGDNVDIVLVENYACENKEELHQRERYYIENNECINKVIPLRTRKEHYLDNKDKIKKYYEDNKDKIKQVEKKYRENNNDIIKQKKSIKITCECGSEVRKADISKHLKTTKHKKYIELSK